MPDAMLMWGRSDAGLSAPLCIDEDGNLCVAISGTGGSTQDDITGALVTIDVVHHEIHEGEAFTISYKSPDNSPIADNGTIAFAITTTTKYCHFLGQGAMGGDAEIEFYEGADISGGTGTTVHNHKRVGGDATTVTVVRDPTVNDAGTLLEHFFIPGGRVGRAVGGIGDQRFEWILKLGTVYLIRITNRAGGAQPGSLSGGWYEESDN